jgi:predicted dehydrogenase
MNDKRPLRAAILGFWQAHVAPAPDLQFPGPGNAIKAINHPGLDVVSAWDPDPERGRSRASDLGLDFRPDLEDILGDPQIDGVLVTTATAMHSEVIGRAVAARKHVHTSKVLAPTYAEARSMIDAAVGAGVVLVTDMSWLHANFTRKIKEVIEGGRLGILVSLRITHYHGMAVANSTVDQMGYYPCEDRGFLCRREGCGGALVDMCHPTYLTSYLCGGLPTSAFARFASATGRGDVEDNAVVVFDYASGPYVIAEAAWTTSPMTTEISVTGTGGALVYRAVTGLPEADTFTLTSGDVAKVEHLSLGPEPPSTLDLWVDSIRSGFIPTENIGAALDLAVMNEAAYRSAAEGQPCDLSRIAGGVRINDFTSRPEGGQKTHDQGDCVE